MIPFGQINYITFIDIIDNQHFKTMPCSAPGNKTVEHQTMPRLGIINCCTFEPSFNKTIDDVQWPIWWQSLRGVWVRGVILIIQYCMQVREQNHPNGSNLEFIKCKPNKLKIIVNEGIISIRNSAIDLVISGNRNRIRIEDTAGRVTFLGNENQIEIKKSWISCELQGNTNLFGLLHTQFQLKRHQGAGNYIPGLMGEHPLQVANRRMLMQQRYMNIRVHSLRQNSKSIKKYWPSLIKSSYNSECRECPICYDDIKGGEEVSSLFCFHLFHSACIEACLETTTKCPVCSLDILQFISEQIKSGSYVSGGDELLMKESMEDADK